MKNFIAAVALAAFSAPYARPTSVVILANPTEIVVAGDSKVYGSDEKICKIFKVGSLYWTMSGVTGNSITGYDVGSIVRASYVPGQSVARTLDVFMQTVIRPLQRTMIHDLPFPGFKLEKNSPLQIAFWGFENGHPVIAYTKYTTTGPGDQIRVVPVGKQIVEETDPTRADAVVIGVDTKIVQYAEAHPNWLRDLEASAHLFISLAIEESPQTVGYPISVLSIDRHGFRWTNPNECCHGNLRSTFPPEPRTPPVNRN
jgi:hypothetical protein